MPTKRNQNPLNYAMSVRLSEPETVLVRKLMERLGVNRHQVLRKAVTHYLLLFTKTELNTSIGHISK